MCCYRREGPNKKRSRKRRRRVLTPEKSTGVSRKGVCDKCSNITLHICAWFINAWYIPEARCPGGGPGLYSVCKVTNKGFIEKSPIFEKRPQVLIGLMSRGLAQKLIKLVLSVIIMSNVINLASYGCYCRFEQQENQANWFSRNYYNFRVIYCIFHSLRRTQMSYSLKKMTQRLTKANSFYIYID